MSNLTSTQEKTRRKITYVPSNELPKEGYVRKPTVLKLIGVSSTTWHNWIKAGIAPSGVLLSPRCRVWTAQSIREFMANRESVGV